MASCGRSWDRERRESGPDEDAPSIIVDETLKPATGERKSPEIPGAFKVGKNKKEDIVWQVRESMCHAIVSSKSLLEAQVSTRLLMYVMLQIDVLKFWECSR